MGDAALCGDIVRALAASSDDDAGRAELLKAARVCVEADATVCDGKVLAAVLASLQKCGPLSRRAAHEALGAVFASGRCDLEEVQARDVCRAACAALDAPDDVFDESVATQAAKNALYAAGHFPSLAADVLKRLADAAGRRGAARRKAVFAFVAACLAHSTIGAAPVRAALDRVCAALRRALDDDDVDVAALATDVVGRLEDALGADVVGRALAEAAAARRRKRSGRVAEAAREKVVDPRGAAKRRRGDRRSKRRVCVLGKPVLLRVARRDDATTLTRKRKMILTKCAACAAPLAHNAPRCVRCHTRYCNKTCQHDHWRRGHKQICKRIHRGGNAEQYHADKKYKEAVAVAAERRATRTAARGSTTLNFQN